MPKGNGEMDVALNSENLTWRKGEVI